MDINKQLFEDVLSGKLKGTFVLRDGNKISHKTLFRTNNNLFPYAVLEGDILGLYRCFSDTNKFSGDIINFIPDTNMKENELTIEIPDGKIVDWEESKRQNKIVLKDKQLTYEEICKKLFSKLSTYYFVNNHGSIHAASSICNPYISNSNSASTTHQLECILAKNRLANVAVYLNDGWKPLWDSSIFLLRETKTGVSVFEVANGSCASDCGTIWFKTKEAAQQAIEILGEETVKLALEPLGV